jgi:multiple sugar transport system permease protein/putative chitobiose transport system permease protein
LDIFGLSADGQAAGLNFQKYIMNSLIVAVAVVGSSVVVSTMGAYFFARLKFPFKKVLMVLMILSMLLPIEATMVPLYIVVSNLGLADSFLGIIIPWYTSPFFIFSLTQFMKDIPYELDEAATIDGASKLGILWYIIIPNAIPGLVTNALIEFQYAWNLFYWPLIVASKKELLMLQVAIAGQSSMARIYYGRILAGATVASIPVIILFLLLQRYYVQGTALSGIKG